MFENRRVSKSTIVKQIKTHTQKEKKKAVALILVSYKVGFRDPKNFKEGHLMLKSAIYKKDISYIYLSLINTLETLMKHI